jgi:ribose 5-phosphate isomerase B
MKIVIAADPFALDLKKAIEQYLIDAGHEVTDLGTVDAEHPVPFYAGATAASQAIVDGKFERGILLCGTGMGMAISANKFKRIRASVVESVFAAKMCRSINDSNVLTIGSMIVGPQMAIAAVEAFLQTEHTEGLEQYADMLKEACKKVDQIEETNLR